MRDKRCFSFLSLVFIVLAGGARMTYACSCGPQGTVLEAYEGASVVVVVRAVSIEKSESDSSYGGIIAICN